MAVGAQIYAANERSLFTDRGLRELLGGSSKENGRVVAEDACQDLPISAMSKATETEGTTDLP